MTSLAIKLNIMDLFIFFTLNLIAEIQSCQRVEIFIIWRVKTFQFVAHIHMAFVFAFTQTEWTIFANHGAFSCYLSPVSGQISISQTVGALLGGEDKLLPFERGLLEAQGSL